MCSSPFCDMLKLSAMLLQGADGDAQGAPCGLIHQHRGDGKLPDAARIGQQHCNEHREAHRHQLHRGGAGLGILCLICGLQAASQAGKAPVVVQAALGLCRGCIGGFNGLTLVAVQYRDHALRQVVGLGDVPRRQAGVLAGDQQTDVLLLQRSKTACHIAAAHITQHEHGVQVAGHCQIQNLQLAIFGVAVLVVLLRQGHALLLHVAAGADEDAVIVAPRREAQSGVLLQILDREQDVCAFLNDLAEQIEAQKRIAELYKANWKDLSSYEGSPFVGPKDAKVTIVEFFDFNCGYCKRLAPELMKVIKANPKVKVVFKPVTFLGSMPAAKAAMAANKQGKFLEVYEALLTHNGQITTAVIEDIIKKAGLDVEKTKKLMESDEIAKEISAIAGLSQKVQIRGVPTLIMNGEALQVIDADTIQNAINNVK